MVELEHHTRTVSGVRLHDVTAGAGDPVVLLHGWPQTWFAWRGVIPILAEHHLVIAPDTPGCGDSSKPHGGYDKKTVAADIRELVHELGHDRIFLAGHDMGAQVAYPYAAQWPDEVRAMAFIDATLPHFGQEKQMDVSHGGSWVVGFNMAGDITEELVRGRERLLVEYWMRHSDVALTDPTAATDEAIDCYAHAMSLPGGLRGSFGYWRAILEDWEDNKRFGEHKLAMPVLAVRGDHVFEINADTTMRQVATDVEEVVLERCGHYVPEERPAELAAALLRFFGASR